MNINPNRKRCECGRPINITNKNGICPLCRRNPEPLQPRESRSSYSLEDEIAILSRAKWAERQGYIPPWSAVDYPLPNGPMQIRYKVAGALMDLEDFDLYVAAGVRAGKAKTA